MKKMLIIGAGAAGMMTAIHASSNYNVTIIEQNEKPGKKLYITGKGRCNVTNASDEEIFLRNVITNPKFLYSAIYSYNQDAVMSDLESWGVPLKVERGDRVFPVSDHSSDIIKALTKRLGELGVRILYNTKVIDIITENDDEGIIRATGVKVRNSKSEIINTDVVVIATGGFSYQTTGSTGMGYEFLRKYGIDIREPRPSLVPVVVEEDFVKDMMGLSLKNISLKVTALKDSFSFLKKDKLLYDGFGEMLFTHFGVSGPLVLSASSYISSFIAAVRDKGIDASYDDVQGIALEINLKPALSYEELDRRILRDFEEFSNRDFQNSLGKLLPRLMIPPIIKRSRISPDKKVNLITSEERGRLVDEIMHFTLTMRGLRGFNEAIITGGGVNVKEINPQTMELKKIRGLRVAGEIIDCDALTGGFNLQIAWSTAFLAGQ